MLTPAPAPVPVPVGVCVIHVTSSDPDHLLYRGRRAPVPVQSRSPPEFARVSVSGTLANAHGYSLLGANWEDSTIYIYVPGA
jgi:hypothetical protein